MAEDSISRRNFLTTMAVTTASASLAEPSDVVQPTRSRAANMPIKVVCNEKLSEAEVNQIKSAGKNIELQMAASQDALKKCIAEAEVVLGRLDGDTVKLAKNLKWFQNWGAGMENVLSKELIEHPCQVTNMQRTFAPVISETAIALLLSLTRGLTQVSIPAFQKKEYKEADDISLDDLYGKTIGIVGMGGIGSETARRLHYGFNMKVLATDAKPMPKPEFVAELHDPSWLMEMVPQVDVLMSAAPLTKETKQLFDSEVFSKMKPSAYFINVSRGGLVDQDALVKALKEKKIRGAGLDVVSPEPLPASHPLWTCPNLVITPHNSGEAPIRQVRLMALVSENIRRYSNGLPLLNVVDKAKGY
ncbi:D-2-hydroxyacid dehydrogenase [Rhodocytophaga rosea]|uniref:D-2-hydroxyacid dehydrogenase n=1 Tax=Rhodocytophaga rosea TaxID=2704465 RepID=A0A6C0GCM6_9BACT|nr:D-2-hydroxyacid dehydrogenase [Rhodocytophaga rosea]QHT65721.1 D-2-hydroxyacid dehydrogenase [Rhodocytophaga rosea]